MQHILLPVNDFRLERSLDHGEFKVIIHITLMSMFKCFRFLQNQLVP